MTIPFISADGLYQVNVAGESFYPEAFMVLAGPKRAEGVYIETRAQLTLQDDNEHDKMAVKVTIDGHQVGHLPKDAARAFRRTVRYGALSIHETFECAAIICGGWANESGIGNYGVRLDLNIDD